MGTLGLTRAFLETTRLFLTLPDSIGTVTGFLDGPGLFDIEDLTGTGADLLDCIELFDITYLTWIVAGNFNCTGLLYIKGKMDKRHFFFDFKTLRVRLTVLLYSIVFWSKLW